MLNKYPEETARIDISQKEKQKLHSNSNLQAKKHINVGDSVLLKQKNTKCSPPYDPDPYTVIEIKGHQITAVRNGILKTRDSLRWTKFTGDSDNEILDMGKCDKNNKVDTKELHEKQRTTSHMILDDPRNTTPTNTPQPKADIVRGESPRIPARRAPSTRLRQPPPRYRDLIAKILNSETQDYHKSL